MPQHNLFFQPAAGAVMALNGDKQTHANAELLANGREHVAYVVWSAGAAAGIVLVESAHDPTYTGVWSTVATINWAAGSKVDRVNFTGRYQALRFRCSSDVTGGNAKGYFGAN